MGSQIWLDGVQAVTPTVGTLLLIERKQGKRDSLKMKWLRIGTHKTRQIITAQDIVPQNLWGLWGHSGCGNPGGQGNLPKGGCLWDEDVQTYNILKTNFHVTHTSHDDVSKSSEQWKTELLINKPWRTKAWGKERVNCPGSRRAPTFWFGDHSCWWISLKTISKAEHTQWALCAHFKKRKYFVN